LSRMCAAARCCRPYRCPPASRRGIDGATASSATTARRRALAAVRRRSWTGFSSKSSLRGDSGEVFGLRRRPFPASRLPSGPARAGNSCGSRVARSPDVLLALFIAARPAPARDDRGHRRPCGTPATGNSPCNPDNGV
jgi:hypothetical protein